MSDENLTQAAEGTEGTEPTTTVSESGVTTAKTEVVADTSPKPWYSEDYADVVKNKGWETPDDALKSFKSLEAMVGNSVRIPPADASPEAKQEFLDKIKDVDGVLIKSDEKLMNKLGAPETPDAYELEKLISEDLGEVAQSVSPEMDDFKKIAHEIGLTKEQAAKLAETRLASVKAEAEETAKRADEVLNTLKQDWGSDYENRMKGIKQVAEIYAQKDNGRFANDIQALINSPAGNNPAVLHMLNELAESYKEQQHAGLAHTNFGLTPEMAARKIADKKADVGFMEAYMNDRHPGHAKAVEEMLHLHQVKHGEA